MFSSERLMFAVIFVPMLALLVMLLAGTELSERYHLHHDTYAVSPVVSRTLVLVMVFMGVLGFLVGWLCGLGVFTADPILPLTFFLVFELTLLVLMLATMHHQVMAYGDSMMVRPAFGRLRTIAYDHIVRMQWVPSRLGPHLRDLRVLTDEGERVRIWCLLDIEQVLLRIDRFEVLEA